MAKKTSKSQNLKLTQALFGKTDKPTTNPIFCKTPPLILNLKPKGKNSARVQAIEFMLPTKPYPCNFQEKYGNPKP